MNLITETGALKAFVSALSQSPFITIDTEFHREKTYYPEVCLIQIAGYNSEGAPIEALVDPRAKAIDIAPLWALCADEAIVKVFHSGRQDLEIFYHLSKTLPKPFFDTQIGAMALGLGEQVSYDNLVRHYLNISVDKTSRFTDWKRRPLTHKQLTYALGDVTHLRDIYPKMIEELKSSGRYAWIEENLSELLEPGLYDIASDEAWQKLKLRSRRKKYLALLRQLAAWREEAAKKKNVPRRRIVSDDALQELSEQAPASKDKMKAMRALSDGFSRSAWAEEVLRIISKTLEDIDAYAPEMVPAAKKVDSGAIGELLRVWLKAISERENISARLIASSRELDALAIDIEGDHDITKGWRGEIFGQSAKLLCKGEAALMVHNGEIVFTKAVKS